MSRFRIAIVYDWMDSMGGVERMLPVLHDMYPTADWYTSTVDSKKASWIPKAFGKDRRIHTTFIQKLPSFIRQSRIFSLLFYPLAFESFDFSRYDVVISVSSSFAKGIITSPHTKHICILLTPTRWIWSHQKEYFSRLPWYAPRFIYSVISRWLKRWDTVASSRPDEIVAISHTVQKRCRTYYHRTSDVIFPPFAKEYWQGIKKHIPQKRSTQFPQNYFLLVSRLEPYKNVELAIRTFNSLPKHTLVIVGTGRQERKMKQISKSNILFVENIDDSTLAQYYTFAEGLIMPQAEDFGYVSLEAQFFGCPVIAYCSGGARETVKEGKSGILFFPSTEKALRDAVAKYRRAEYNLQYESSDFRRWSRDTFVASLTKKISQAVREGGW